jgi:MFS family permease
VRGVSLSTNGAPAGTATEGSGSAWSPFRHKAYAVLWIATVVSNIGTWMYNAASGWLMTSLDPDPFIVAMVQVATTLPMFLFALPAGALADIIDKRLFLIAVEVATTAVSAIYAAIVWLGLATSDNLLLFTFLIGAGGALTAPAWQSIVPQLVPKQDLHPAVAANSVGINVSRALGPALGGGDLPKRAVACRPSILSAPRERAFATRATTRICARH